MSAESADAPTASNVITEGKATIQLCGESPVFYNPVQEFNRDLSIAVLRQFVCDYQTTSNGVASSEAKRAKVDKSPDITLLEAMSATGLRAVRYAKEVEGLSKIIANDFSSDAVRVMEANIASNEVGRLVESSEGDAAEVMFMRRRKQDRFTVIDLDPYGSPSIMLDSAVQAVDDGGLLMVTATDSAVLCGNTPETCHAKYGSLPLKSKCCHESGLRILLHCIETHANRYSRYIEPLLSVSADFYVRVFMRIRTSASVVKRSVCKLAYIYQCVGCEAMTLQPMVRRDLAEDGKTVRKYVPPHGPTAKPECEHCGRRQILGGPIWSDPIHDQEFVRRMQDSMKNENSLGTIRRIRGVLSVVLEELPDVPLYYVHDRLCSLVKSSSPKLNLLRSAILNAGYRVSTSHACANSIKTDAPMGLIWDILRCWARKAGVELDKLPEDGVARTLLSADPQHIADFKPNDAAEPLSKIQKMLRYQPNPEPNWGPARKARILTPDDRDAKPVT